jgi:1-deoxy-D-xylulose-5-phosphate reductoisomerase
MPRIGAIADMRRVAILGSTGSIGTQALDVISERPESFSVVGIASSGRQPTVIAEQARKFGVELIAVSDASAHASVRAAVEAQFPSPEGIPTILSGPDAASEVASMRCDVVLNAMSGASGLRPTLAALEAGRLLALANKESLIIGGPLVAAVTQPGQIVPVDSEHSAIAQCLRSGSSTEVRRLILTASGGPFRGFTAEDLRGVSVQEALAHPTWDMGPLVTINSATMMNKGLEVIEAHLLFDVAFDDIDVVVHPQSVVHSMVEFVDGSIIAQASPPDMRLPIALGLAWPNRVPGAVRPCDWSASHTWQFHPVDHAVFPAINLAMRVGRLGGTAPAVMNAADEVAVDAFLSHQLAFDRIVALVEHVVELHLPDHGNPITVDDVLHADRWARAQVHELLEAGWA